MIAQSASETIDQDRRQLLSTAAMGIVAAGAASLLPVQAASGKAGGEIRSFHVHVPEATLVDLRRRLGATRWPEKETVSDDSQGVQLATVKKLVQYWQTDYDWRKVEARLNALPQFTTEIDGIDIHFIHVRSRHDNALPLIVTHGWPGSIIEQLKIVDRLVNPLAHGAAASDAFDVVIPSIPGYGFSGKPEATGWDPQRIARAWIVLMKRLGYTRFVAQGGDWGNAITEQMALLGSPELVGIHTNMPATVPDDIAASLQPGGTQPSGLSAEEQNAWNQLDFFYKHGLGYAHRNGEPPADALRHHGFAGRPCRLDPRPRYAQPSAHRTCLRGRVCRAYAGRHPGQHHPVLGDEHGDVVGTTLLGEQASVLSAEEGHHSGGGECVSG